MTGALPSDPLTVGKLIAVGSEVMVPFSVGDGVAGLVVTPPLVVQPESATVAASRTEARPKEAGKERRLIFMP